jgi:Protein of unknown function (DUF1569)
MNRRQALIAATLPGTLAVGACGVASVQGFATLEQARSAIATLGSRHGSRGAWSLPQTLVHLAQSIEYSIDGFPLPKPAWFTATVGPAAFAWFESRGRMDHALDEPIPGAPPLADSTTLADARHRLLASIDRFELHAGTIAPHFAYGALDKDATARAHLMHIANHWTEFQALA